jgi:Uma2 family endonuclease
VSAPIDLARHWTIADLDELPDDGNRYEIVDGNLVVSPPPPHVHQWRAAFLARQLQAQAPDGWLAITELSLPLGDDFRIPDLVVHRWPITPTTGYEKYPMGPADVGLLLEVVSPRSRKTDRFLKPIQYAAADVPVYWRLECEPELVLHPFVLQDGVYAPRNPITTTGTVPAPWGDIEVDLTQLP